MILSHTHRYIFLKTRKTAGTSFEIALSKYVEPDDIVTPLRSEDEAIRSSLGYAGPQNFVRVASESDNHKEHNYYNHMPANKVKAYIGDTVFKEYLKVSIVRNPFEMAVSKYFWHHRENQENSTEHFRKWLLSKWGVKNRNRKITHIKGQCAVDVMIRFEDFEKDTDSFAKRVGLPPTLFKELNGIRAKGSYRPRDVTPKAFFDTFTEGKQLIEQLYAEEIKIYNYSCP